MGSLIKNEFIKLTKKKSTLIILIIFLVYIIFSNFMMKYVESFMNYDYRTNEEYIEFVKEQLETINPNEDPYNYIAYKNDLDFYNLYTQYDKDSWQAYIINRDFSGYINNVNVYKYGTPADKQAIEGNPEEEYNIQLQKLSKSDWQGYVKDEIDILNEQLIAIQGQYDELKAINKNSETQEMQDLSEQIKTLESKRDLLQYRIDNVIPYGNNFLNDAILTIEVSSNLDYDYNKNDLSYAEKVERQEEITNYEKAKYALKNKQDVANASNLRGTLMDIYSGYFIFILVFIAMVAGTIVSSEFEKGTIKMLLVKPYKRWKILLSKYIVSLIMMLFIIVFTVVFHTLIGGIIQGFSSLSVPVVEYNFTTNSLVTYNLFHYVLIITLSKLPMFILLTTIAFAVSAITTNSAVSIIIPIIINTASSIINAIVTPLSIKQAKFLPSLNWDLSQFLFGKLPQYEFTNFAFALGISVLYWGILVAAAFIAFNKKQIKNI